jgi:hypothetical protein
MHVASECLWAHSLRIEVASLWVVTSTVVRFHTWCLKWASLSPPMGLTVRWGYLAPIQMTQPDVGRDPSR